MTRRLAIVLSFLVISGVSLGQNDQSQEPAVRRVIGTYDHAWNDKNLSTIDRILAPDYVYFSSKGEVRSRQSLLDELLSQEYVLSSAERSELKVYITSSTAVVSSRWKGQGAYEGHEFHDDQRCSIVLTREKQKWLVLSEHCTQIVAR